jgi:hypothetical protein
MAEPRIIGLVPWLPWPLSSWQAFTQPIRAERLAVLRIALALVMLADVLTTYGPHVNDFYGPDSLARVGERELFAHIIRGGERPSWYWSIFRGFGHPANLGAFLTCSVVLTGWAILRMMDKSEPRSQGQLGNEETLLSWNWLIGAWIVAATLSTIGLWQQFDSLPKEVEPEWRAGVRAVAGIAFVAAASLMMLVRYADRRDDFALGLWLTFAFIVTIGLFGIAAWQALFESGLIERVPLLADTAVPLDLEWLTTPWDGNALALRIAVYVLGIAIVLLLLGICTHFSALMVWILFSSFDNLNHYLTDTGEVIRYIALLYVLIAPSGGVWSVDAWLARTDDRRPAYVSPWPVRLMFLQLCLLYFATGVFKLSGYSWFDGSSLYRVLACVTLTRFSFSSLPFTYEMLRLGTWTVLIWEVTFPFMALFRWTRVVALLLGVIFHVGIWVTFEIGFFAPYMLCFYVPLLPWERTFFAAKVTE